MSYPPPLSFSLKPFTPVFHRGINRFCVLDHTTLFQTEAECSDHAFALTAQFVSAVKDLTFKGQIWNFLDDWKREYAAISLAHSPPSTWCILLDGPLYRLSDRGPWPSSFIRPTQRGDEWIPVRDWPRIVSGADVLNLLQVLAKEPIHV